MGNNKNKVFEEEHDDNLERIIILEKENIFLQEQIADLNNKLKEEEKMKSHFLSNMMNEIVNPFASILGLSKNISKSDGQNIEKIKSMANMIFTEAFELDFQLKNIFAAAEIEAGEVQLQLSDFKIKSLIESSVDEVGLLSRRKVIDINIIYSKDIEAGSMFINDFAKMKLILVNLLSNAIKFGTPGVEIIIDVYLDAKEFVFKIKNYGKGIDKENLKNIFDRFKQIETTIHSLNTGHGLGLSIVKAYCDILNGKVAVESIKNEFVEFTVTIPEANNSGEEYFSSDIDLFEDEEEFF